MGNLHPALVHIPIGILFLYSLAEWCRWGKFFQSTQWNTSKAFMVTIGVLGSFAAFASGDALEDIYGSIPLLETHSMFATATIVVYSLLAFGYLVWVIDNSKYGNTLRHSGAKPVWHFCTRLSRFLRNPIVSVSGAFIGFILLTITGALGGAIVRGREADFLVTIIYDLFVK